MKESTFDREAIGTASSLLDSSGWRQHCSGESGRSSTTEAEQKGCTGQANEDRTERKPNLIQAVHPRVPKYMIPLSRV